MYKVGILTCSDKCSQGLREDESGRVIREILEIKGCQRIFGVHYGHNCSWTRNTLRRCQPVCSIIYRLKQECR